MTKQQLHEFCVNNRVYVPTEERRFFEAKQIARFRLVEYIENAIDTAPSVYGHTRVHVRKQPARCLWEVFTEDQNTRLCNVPWRNLYEDTILSPNNRAALSACIVIEPLEPEEEEELFRRFPNLRGRTPFQVDETLVLWELEEEDSRVEEPSSEGPEDEPAPRKRSLKRKISI